MTHGMMGAMDEQAGQPEQPGHDTRDLLLEALEREVGVLMQRARRVMAVRAQFVHPDLAPTAYLVLGLVCERGEVRASAVAECFQIDKGAVSRTVQHLVDLGLVDRLPDPEDRRATLLVPTEGAVRRMRELIQLRRARLKERLGIWDDDGLEAFVADLQRYNLALGGIEGEQAP